MFVKKFFCRCHHNLLPLISGCICVIIALASSTLAQTGDTAPPIIRSVKSSNILDLGATITWITNEPADSQVEYGTTTAYGTLSSLVPDLSYNHWVNLWNLTPGTLYHFRVRSRDASGVLALSADFTFTTTGGI